MASIEEGGGGGGHKKGPGVKKAKKLSTRVDMTPMVDLGFLLITFFIFTTTMSTPSTMDLYMPKDTKDDKDQNKAKESGALTIMLAKNNVVYYYEGQLLPDASNFQTTTFAKIRDEIISKRKAVIASHVHDAGCEAIWAKNGGDKNSCLDRDFVVVIKPDPDATYKNTVDILDEMTINGVKRFAMVDLFPQELDLIHKTEGTYVAPTAETAPAK
ncbi:MAG: biopolymer transporter ExbD [Chitinophagaceae bacterium]